jgi:hypothetical protein
MYHQDILNVNKYFYHVKNDEEFNYKEDELEEIDINVFEDGVNKVEKVKIIKSCAIIDNETSNSHYLTLNGVYVQSFKFLEDKTYNVCLNKKFKEFTDIQFVVPKNVTKHIFDKIKKGNIYIKLLFEDALLLTINYIRDKCLYNLVNINNKLEDKNKFLLDLVKKLSKINESDDK